MELAQYIIGGLSLLIAVISFIVARVKAVKTGNLEAIQELDNLLQGLIITAEKTFGSGNGELKLDNVVTKATLYCLQNGIKITQAELTNKINRLVETTNNVNVNKTTTTPTAKTGSDKPDTEIITNNTKDIINI